LQRKSNLICWKPKNLTAFLFSTRRHFMMKLLAWGKMAALSGLLPSCFPGIITASGRAESVGTQTQGLSLRDLARKKLHHDNGRFRNPFTGESRRSPWPLIKWKLFSRNEFRALYSRERVQPVSVDWDAVRAHNGLSVTFLKHAGILIKDRGSHILVDPAFSSPSRFVKDFTPLAFDIGRMPAPTWVLITHGHYDHLDVPTLSRFPKETPVLTPLGYDDVLADLGTKKHVQLDWFETFTEGGLEITLLPCNHWTMRNPFYGPNLALWGSFLIKTVAGPTIYVSGDTGYFDGFCNIGREFSIDLAVMNLGAYEPRWFMAPSHMNPAETAKAIRELGAAKCFIVHWGTFRLGDEPVYLPPNQIREELEKEGLLDRFVHLEHGKTLFFKV
jgi:N-acyl-phosphatidylethanolamine-hydrolysing phospholipase D